MLGLVKGGGDADIWTGCLSAHELGLSQWEWEVHMQLLLLAKNL